jgi:hypothetical protein
MRDADLLTSTYTPPSAAKKSANILSFAAVAISFILLLVA